MQGIVTGASRGLGLALTRALAERGWRLVVDARDGDALGARGRRSRRVSRDRRRRRRPRPPAPPRRGCRRLDRPARQQRQRARPDAAAAAGATTRSRRCAASTRSTCSLRSRSCSSRCRGSPTARAIVNLSSDAAVEAYETWGGYGSSKAALAQLTAVLAAENPGLRAYAVDPGDMRTQMQQEAFPGEDISDRPPPEESVPGLLRADRGRRCRAASTAPASSSGPRRERARDRLRARLEAHEPPEARGAAGRDNVRLLSPSRRTARSSTAGFATCRTSSRRATSSSSTPRPRSRRPCRRRVRTASGSSSGSRRRPRARIPSGSGSSSSAAATRRSAASRSASASCSRAAARPRSSRPTPASGSGSLVSTCRCRSRLPRRARAADPLRLRPAALAALGVPERLRGRARQRRDAERRPAVHDGADHASSSPAACSSRRSCCTPASRRRSATSARTRSAIGSPSTRRGW